LGQPRVATRCSLSRDEFIWMRIQNLKSMSFNCVNFEPDFFEGKRVRQVSSGGSIPRMNSVTTVALSGVIGAPNSQFDWRWLPQRNCERCLALSESAGARNSRAYCPGDSPHSPYGPRVSIGGDNSSRREIHSRCESNGSYVHAALCLLYRAGNRRSIPKLTYPKLTSLPVISISKGSTPAIG
jgi:hypothetical protein